MASGSKKAVYSAIIANSIVGVAKFVGFFFSGSGALLSEGIHSLADVSNQILLAIGLARSEREPTPEHPYGYGREAFLFALISAVGIFWFGCGVTLYHGISGLLHPHEVEAPQLAMGILIFSVVVESITLWIAFKVVLDSAKEAGMGFREYLTKGSDPMGVAVLLEDGAAVFGVLLAMATLGLSMVTHNPIWDAVGSTLIAILLGAVAIFLVLRNRTMLLEPSISTEQRSQVLDVLDQDPVVESVHDVKTTVIGTNQVRFKAEIDFDGAVIAQKYLKTQDLNALQEQLQSSETLEPFLVEYGNHIVDALGDEIDRLEKKIQQTLPSIKHVDIEAD